LDGRPAVREIQGVQWWLVVNDGRFGLNFFQNGRDDDQRFFQTLSPMDFAVGLLQGSGKLRRQVPKVPL
jgi:hypothetical protein